MGKNGLARVALVVFGSLFTLTVSCVENLSAGGPVAVTGINNAGIVETVEAAEDDDSSSLNSSASILVADSSANSSATISATNSGSNGSASTASNTVSATTANTTSLTTTATPSTPNTGTVLTNKIVIAGKTLPISSASSTTEDAGTGVKSIGKLLYGHNSAAVFGGLKNLGVGATFTVYDGVGNATTYRISEIKTFEKNTANGLLQLDGKGSYMSAILNKAMGHDIAVMTCAGTSYGNGDASHRLVLLADAI